MRKDKTDKAAKEIKRLWGDLPVIDAKKDLRVFINPVDLAHATRKDPGSCVFAQACKRTFGSTKVLFYRKVAYVELPDDQGRMHVERFLQTKATRRLVENFDKGNPIIPTGGFLLKRIPPGRTFEYERNRDQERRDRRKLLGTRQGEGGNTQKKFARYRDKSVVRSVDLEVRNGMGAVHFTIKRKNKTPPSAA